MKLPKKGPKAFEIFISALVLSGQDFLAEELHPQLAPKALQENNGEGDKDVKEYRFSSTVSGQGDERDSTKLGAVAKVPDDVPESERATVDIHSASESFII